MERVDGDVEYKSPVDTVIVDKDPATIKKRTAPFKAPAPKAEKKESAVTEGEMKSLRSAASCSTRLPKRPVRQVTPRSIAST